MKCVSDFPKVIRANGCSPGDGFNTTLTLERNVPSGSLSQAQLDHCGSHNVVQLDLKTVTLNVWGRFIPFL